MATASKGKEKAKVEEAPTKATPFYLSAPRPNAAGLASLDIGRIPNKDIASSLKAVIPKPA